MFRFRCIATVRQPKSKKDKKKRPPQRSFIKLLLLILLFRSLQICLDCFPEFLRLEDFDVVDVLHCPMLHRSGTCLDTDGYGLVTVVLDFRILAEPVNNLVNNSRISLEFDRLDFIGIKIGHSRRKLLIVNAVLVSLK